MRYKTLELKLHKKRLYIEYTSTEADTTGLGGTWEGGGTYAQVHFIDGYILLMAFVQKPVMICKDFRELQERLFEKTNCQLQVSREIENKFKARKKV